MTDSVRVEPGKTLASVDVAGDGDIHAIVIFEGSDDQVTWHDLLRVTIVGRDAGRVEFPLEPQCRYIRKRIESMEGQILSIEATLEALG